MIIQGIIFAAPGFLDIVISTCFLCQYKTAMENSFLIPGIIEYKAIQARATSTIIHASVVSQLH